MQLLKTMKKVCKIIQLLKRIDIEKDQLIIKGDAEIIIDGDLRINTTAVENERNGGMKLNSIYLNCT